MKQTHSRTGRLCKETRRWPPSHCQSPVCAQARLDLHCNPVTAEVHAQAASAAATDVPDVNGQLHVKSMPAEAAAANGWHESAKDGKFSAGYGVTGPEATVESERYPGISFRRITVELTAVEGTEDDDGRVLLQLSAPPTEVVDENCQRTKAGPVPYDSRPVSQLQPSAADDGPCQNGTVKTASGGAVSRSASPGPRLQMAAAGSGGPPDATTLHEKVPHTAHAHSVLRSSFLVRSHPADGFS